MATLRIGGKSSSGPRGKTFSTPLRKRLWRDRWMYLFILPGLAYFLLFIYLPILGNFIAWKDYAPFVGLWESPWVGWANFELLFTDPDFQRALINTVQIEILQLVFAFPAPLALALLLHSIMSERLKRAIQSIVYLPHFLSWVIVIALWQQIFGGAGFINQLLANQDMDRINVMSNPDLFKPLVVLQSMWKDVGWGTIIFLAALTRIDTTLYEAAVIDGANGRRRLLDVTLPGIMSIIILLLILRMGSMFSTGFEQYFLQRNAVGPEAAEVIDTFVYTRAFQSGDWSFATAVGLVRGVVAAFMIIGANWLAKRFTGEGLL
ncbi:MAG: ABC transporter, permease protein 1 (cluster 1, maltose/g3p/polyamine/iron) [uncultured Thermomicrobiales bacterium]|uniref:ABC transporter, permease protein 1 (Cluster 1, maltose/g3p/polyamine/iron) n=1 Tax=uncultured Thermomicrobiales bacterium TaxID=1645740 RepID=A0A6J4V273_9BACT|nr:MAG: ABC transporter, permease protein 1 (cluster 1, maltose/g3p/polyamine/iron) [uncultured Thermomicrobiales bacterium]